MNNLNRFEQMLLECFSVFVIGFACFLILSGVFSYDTAIWILRLSFVGFSAVGIAYGLARLMQKITAQQLRLELFKAHISKKQNQAGFMTAPMEHGLFVDCQSRAAQFFTKNRVEKHNIELSAQTSTAFEGQNTSVIKGLDALSQCDSVLICGGKGAGKTNLAFHLTDMQMRKGCEVFVIDPKPQFDFGKWGGARVIGANHNYREITSFLSDMTAEMKNDRKQVRIWIDEMTVLNMQIKRFSSLWIPILIEGREYGKFISIIGQSKTAGSIGLEGRYDLTDCFDAIAVCRHNKVSDNRYIELELAGEDAVVCHAPEKYRSLSYHGNHSITQSQGGYKEARVSGDTRDDGDGDNFFIAHDPAMREFAQNPQRFYESKAEKQAVEMAKSGESLSKIASEIFGGKSGARVRTIRAWVEKHLEIT